jgi:type IV pilus assembly protein PilW
VSSNNKGFTLIELLIAVTISVVAMAMIYAGYKSQQEAQTNERLVVDMQQNGRSTLAFMRREIRMADYAPRALNGIDDDIDGSIDEADESSVTGFRTVRANTLNFTFDLNGNGVDTDPNEDITYAFSTGDGNSDGIADSGAAVLSRRSRVATMGGVFQDLAFDVHAIAFAYAFDDDGDGGLDTYPGVPGGVVVWAYDSDGDNRLDRHLDTNTDGLIDENDAAGGATLSSAGVADVDRSSVRAVQVWLLTRSQVPMKGRSAAAQSFVVGPNHITVTDGFRRAVFNSMITVRNP